MAEELASELLSAIRELAAQVQVLRQTVDDVREELHWANNNAQARLGFGRTRRITSVPLDPAASDWSAGVNRVQPETVKQLRSEAASPASGNGSQTRLF